MAVDKTPARYDEIADFYEGFAPDTYDDSMAVALLGMVGDVQGLRVLDLACGQGRMTRELARRGGRVTGVDISGAQLEKGRTREQNEPLGVSYVHEDAALPGALAGQEFDMVVCHFGMSDIDDLEGVVATVARVLRKGGRFIFSIVHPCFPGWEGKRASPSWQPGTGYFEEKWWLSQGPPGGVRTKVGANHRMLSTYINTLVLNGLAIEEMAEPKPPEEWMEVAPVVGAVPIYLVMGCRRL